MHHPTKSQQTRIRQMANVMVEEGDDCTVETLVLRKFTRREIALYWPAAAETANARSERPGRKAA